MEPGKRPTGVLSSVDSSSATLDRDAERNGSNMDVSLDRSNTFPSINVPELPSLADLPGNLGLDFAQMHNFSRDYRDHLAEIAAAINDRKTETVSEARTNKSPLIF